MQSSPSHGLIYGLDPLRADHAAIIIDTPEHHSAMRRALAYATIKTARGETVNRRQMIADALATQSPEAQP